MKEKDRTQEFEKIIFYNGFYILVSGGYFQIAENLSCHGASMLNLDEKISQAKNIIDKRIEKRAKLKEIIKDKLVDEAYELADVIYSHVKNREILGGEND